MLYLEDTVQDGHGVGVGTALLIRHNVIQPNLNIQCTISNSYFPARVVDPYSFFTDPDPYPELDVGGQYGSGSKSGSGSGSRSNTDPGL